MMRYRVAAASPCFITDCRIREFIAAFRRLARRRRGFILADVMLSHGAAAAELSFGRAQPAALCRYRISRWRRRAKRMLVEYCSQAPSFD